MEQEDAGDELRRFLTRLKVTGRYAAEKLGEAQSRKKRERISF